MYCSSPATYHHIMFTGHYIQSAHCSWIVRFFQMPSNSYMKSGAHSTPPPPPPPPAILLMSKTWAVPKSAYASKTNKLVKKQFKYLTWTKLRVGVVISNLWNLTQNLYNIVSNTAMFWKVCFQDFFLGFSSVMTKYDKTFWALKIYSYITIVVLSHCIVSWCIHNFDISIYSWNKLQKENCHRHIDSILCCSFLK